VHVVIELYSPKPSWHALPRASREALLRGVEAGATALADSGVALIALGRINPLIERTSGHVYFGIWSASDEPATDILLGAIAASGWYEYLDQVNVSGAAQSLQTHLADLLSLSAENATAAAIPPAPQQT